MTFEVGRFWEERLKENPGLSGVGYLSLGLPFNVWMYRVRARVFRREVDTLKIGPRVLDVGSGSGFYIDLWNQLGYAAVGMDISASAIRRLQERYPNHTFTCEDITSLTTKPDAIYDCISAFDVLFHLTQDAGYTTALTNISQYLKLGGLFLYAENLPDTRVSYKHQVSRSRDEVLTALHEKGFVVKKEIPMFVVMNQPIASRSIFLWMYWRFVTKVLATAPWLGALLGAILYPLEMALLSVTKKGSSTKLLVCEKVQ